MCVCLCVTPVYLLTGRGRMSLWLLCQILVACFFPALFWWRIVLPTQLTMPNVLYEIWLVRFACPRSNNMLCGLQKKKKKKLQKASYFNIWIQMITEGGHNIMNTCLHALHDNTLWSFCIGEALIRLHCDLWGCSLWRCCIWSYILLD